MNRTITFVIVSTLFLFGTNANAQKKASLPRPEQRTEEIVYANERTSVVPGYRGYRRPSTGNSSKTSFKNNASELGRNTQSYRKPKPTVGLKPLSKTQATKVAPKIHGHSRRVTNPRLPSPAKASPEFTSLDFQPKAASAYRQDILQPGQRKSRSERVQNVEQIVRASPAQPAETTEAAPVIPGTSRRITSTKITAPAPAIANSSRRITQIKVPEPTPEVQVAAPQIPRSSQLMTSTKRPAQSPVIPRSSRRPAIIKVPVPATEAQVAAPKTNIPAEPQSDIVKTSEPASTSSTFSIQNIKSPSLSQFGHDDLQQSPWKPRPKQAQNRDKVAISVPEERTSLPPLEEIEVSNLFEIVEPAFSSESIVVAVPSVAIPLKSATLDAEDESPFTSFITETVASPRVDTENTALKTESQSESLTEAVSPAASAVAGLTTKARLPTVKKIDVSSGYETGRQESASQAWWFMLPLLVVPVLVMLGWALFGRKTDRQFAEIPAIEIPRQENSPWQKQENAGAETRSRGFHSWSDRAEDSCSETEVLQEETELLDEIKSISSIASNSNSSDASSKPTSDLPAKTKK